MLRSKRPSFIVVARVANFSEQISEYAKQLQTTYDSMKMNQIGQRMQAIATEVEYQTNVLKQVNSIDQEKMNSFHEKLHEVVALGAVRYSGRQFQDPPSPPPGPIIDFTVQEGQE